LPPRRSKPHSAKPSRQERRRDFYEPLRDRLRRAREEADLTQGEVAEHLGIRQPLVSRLEGGDRKLDVFELVELCRFYGKPATYFVPELPQ
jgi:transcriptional regulator with XRE-family HTH domain